MEANIILVCHKCLRELVIPNEQFDPFNPEYYKPARDWEIPKLTKRVIIRPTTIYFDGDRRRVSTPASNIESYCPDCKE